MRVAWTLAVLACLAVPLLAADPAAERPVPAPASLHAPQGAPAPRLLGARGPDATRPAARPAPTDVPARPAEPTSPQSVLRGSVCDERGQPVAGLLVGVRFLRFDRPRTSHVVGSPRVLTTDDHGAFACESPPLARRAEVAVRRDPERRWFPPPTVAACLGGPVQWHFPQARSVVDLNEEGRPWRGPRDERRGWPEVHLRVEQASCVRGRVLATQDGRRQPAVHHTVSATWRQGCLGRRRARQRTNAEGRFELIVPATAADLTVGVPAVGYPSRLHMCGRARRHLERAHPGLAPRPAVPGGPEIEFVLPAVHTLRGRIALHDGTPVVLPHPLLPPPPGGTARVEIRRLDEDEVRVEEGVEGAGSGAFVVRGLPAGRYLLDVERDAHERSGPAVAGRRVVQVPGPPVRIECGQAVTLEGTVHGTDLDGFWVTWIPDRLAAWACAPCQSIGADGDFRFEGLLDEPGSVHVCREHDARQAWVEGVRPTRGPLHVELTPGLEITGRIEGLDPGGGGSWWVEAYNGTVDTFADVEPDGRFVLAGLRPGRHDLILYARHGRSTVQIARRADVVAGSDLRIRVSR